MSLPLIVKVKKKKVLIQGLEPVTLSFCWFLKLADPLYWLVQPVQ